ncbi:glycoside hydrolase domain-containing protein [Streptomyces sp. NPDC102462]|uniref:glycoside hydrolase domain-containing protein n=1 Tax=Streptomyces sp. NPDC102462 TaxID=3366178 RepID=UPI00381162AD
MADEMVLRAQKFVNQVYGSRIGMTVTEDGRTGWNTMYALTRALQYELGITALSNSFGPTTLSTLKSKYPVVNASTVPSADFCRIIQSALYCKGYDGGGIDGLYSDRVASSVSSLKANMGVSGAFPGGGIEPKVFKGLLNMDAYVSVNNGSDSVREIQQWMNGRYVNRQDFYIIPCDGHHSRDVAKSLLYAIQYELGMADGVANGVFGPGTQSGLKNHTVGVGTTGTWALLFTGAMILNAWSVPFGNFTATVADAVGRFQDFVKLPVSGVGDFQTWASLLVSTGDPDRKGTACDGVTKITPARAQALKNAGYKYVGRYLYNPSTTSLPEKAIQPGELDTIKQYGLRCFPIYQTYARSADYYSPDQGNTDCLIAVAAADGFGFKDGTRIYFAVDYDAVDDEVSAYILPYFQAVRNRMTALGSPFSIGVYGPRNICSRVSAAGYASASFVSDMSTGFSGNLGYPMPENWAFDQIKTISVGSGDGLIEIDNNIASGRDTGQGDFHPTPSQTLDVGFSLSYWDAMLREIGDYMESIGRGDSALYIYTRQECLETIVSHDAVLTSSARRYRMRKALIQTSAFWEFCHYSYKDLAEDASVVWYHTAAIPDWGKDLPVVRDVSDSSTGIGKISGRTGILARNNSVRAGILDDSILDTAKESDIFSMWTRLNQDNVFNLSTVPHMHIWGSDGKPGDHAETPIRRPALDYTDAETYELLRRYQGFGDQAEADARLRVPLYQIFEKYNRILRES